MKSNWIKFVLVVVLAVFSLLAAGCSIVSRASDPLDTYETGFAQANGITIAYESYGPIDRETILLIAGTGQQLIDWPAELIEELVQRGYRVVIFDNRDVGLSTKLSEAGLPNSSAITKALQEGQPAPLPYTLQDMAEDATGLLDALDIEKAHIAGMSMGGDIAQLVATTHPERTLSLTLLAGGSSGNPALPAVAKPEAFAHLPPPPPENDREAFIDYQVKVYQALGSPAYPTGEATIRALVQREVERSYERAGLTRQQTVVLVGHLDSARSGLANLRNIQAPTVVLQGAEDPIVPVESAQELAELIPDAELRIISGLGHDIPAQLVPVFADAITAAAARATGPQVNEE
jgi:pimeloyl-ACP methyl ester carboxylesterase